MTMQVEESMGLQSEGSGDDGLEPPGPPAEVGQLFSVAEYQERAAKKFTDKGGVMVESGMPPVHGEASNEALSRLNQAVNNLFEYARDSICVSPERPDLKMSKEEAVGWLLADLYGGCELLKSEARGLGKRVQRSR